MKNLWKRGLSFMMAVFMVFSMLPVQAFALEDDSHEGHDHEIVEEDVGHVSEDSPEQAQENDVLLIAEPEVTETPTEAPTEVPTEAPTEAPAEAPTEAPHVHEYTAGEQLPASCAAQGYTLYVCACGETEQRDIQEALGHSYEETVVAPTTDAQGYTQYTCTRCGDSYQGDFTDALTPEEPEQANSGPYGAVAARMDEILLKYLGTTEPMTQDEMGAIVMANGESAAREAQAEIDALFVSSDAAALTEAECETLLVEYAHFFEFVEVIETVFPEAAPADTTYGPHTPITGVTVTTVHSGSTANGSASVSLSGGTVTVTATTSSYYKGWTATCNITITNASEVKSVLAFDWSINQYGTFTIDGSSTTDSGTYKNALEAGSTVTIKLVSESTKSAASTLTLSNFSLTEVKDSDLKFVFDSGSMTVDGTAITSGYTQTVEEGNSIVLAATAPSGYSFVGWIDSNNNLLSSDNPATITPVEDMTVSPAFASATGNAWWQVGSKLFDNLNDADTAAGGSGTIILAADGALSAGTYTISAGNKLLIPFNSSNTADFDQNPTQTTTYSTPSVYRTLTMAEGAIINCYGSINVNATQFGTSGNSTGKVSGPYGCIDMASGSFINLESGANLYAYGFIGGSGTVAAKSGSNVYELFQIEDWRGGQASTALQDTLIDNAFLLSSFYVQNIEASLTVYNGSTVYGVAFICAGSVGGSYMFTPQTAIAVVGSSGMFQLGDGSYATLTYDGTTDRMILEFYGTMETSTITIEMTVGIGQDLSMDSSDYILGIPSNYTIRVKSGSDLSFTQRFRLLPGTQVYIEEGAEATIASGGEVYLYDADDWNAGTYTYNKTLIQLNYVHARKGAPVTRNTNSNALLQVDGSLTAIGPVYTTNDTGNGGDAAITGSGTFINMTSSTAETTILEVADASTSPATTDITCIPVVGSLVGGSGVESFNTNATYYGANGQWYQYKISGADAGYVSGGIQATDGNIAYIATSLGEDVGSVVVSKTNGDLCPDKYSVSGASIEKLEDGTYQISSFTSATGDVTVTFKAHAQNGQKVKDESSVVSATCTTAETYDMVGYCACGAEISGTRASTTGAAALGHDLDDGAVTTAPTCTQAGVKTFTCQREGCDHTTTEAVAALGHTPGEAEVTEVQAQTCTQGRTYNSVVKCTVCQEELTDKSQYNVADPDKTATGHSYDDGVITTAPNCTTRGEKTFTCQNAWCTDGENGGAHTYTSTEGTDLNPTGHSYNTGENIAGTCQEESKIRYTCTNENCDGGLDEDNHGTTYEVGTDVMGTHDYQVIAAQPPTCTQDGWGAYHECTVCGNKQGYTADPATGHDWAEAWTVRGGYHWHACQNEDCPNADTPAADADANGYGPCTAQADDHDCTTATLCETCQTVLTTAPSTAHAYSENTYDDANHWTECANEGCTVVKDGTTESHAYTLTSIDATSHRKVCSCGRVLENSEASHTLTYRDLENGNHQQYCTDNCGYAAVAAAHTLGDWIQTEETHSQACTADGCGYVTTPETHDNQWVKVDDTNHQLVCKICGYVTKTEAHNFQHKESDTEHWNYCDTCQTEEAGSRGEHDKYWVDAGNGNHYEACDCGWKSSESAHNFEETLTQGDTTHYYACQRCSAKDSEETHSYSWVSADDVTHENKCADCGKVIETGNHRQEENDGTDCTDPTNCEVCGVVMVEASFTAHAYTEVKYDGTNHWTECANEGCTVVQEGTTQAHEHTLTSIDATSHHSICSCGHELENSVQAHNLTYRNLENGYHQQYCTDNCGYEAEQEGHSYGEYVTDENGHKKVCEKCGNVTLNGSHTYATVANGDVHEQQCQVCFYVQVDSAEEHTPVQKYDDTQHWMECSACGAVIGEKADHVLSWTASTESDKHYQACECGWTSEESDHNYSETLVQGETTHYYECAECKAQKKTEEHTYVLTKVNDQQHYKICECGLVEADSLTDHVLRYEQVGETQHKQVCDCGYETKAADHTYGDFLETEDGTEHYKACVCGNVTEKGSHDYQWVQDDPSQHWKQCTTCGDISDEYPKDNHAPQWVTTDEDSHWKLCACGQITETGAHSYGEYVVEDGKHYKQCATCGKHIEEAAHTYTWVTTDADQHWKECVCGHIDPEHPKEDHAPQWVNTDGEKHWKECECGQITEEAEHSYSEQKFDDDEHWMECECGRKSDVSSHDYSTAYSYDASSHYQLCSCGKKRNETSHTLTLKSSSENHWYGCSGCLYTEGTTSHDSNAYGSNASKHWTKCSVCGEKTGTESSHAIAQITWTSNGNGTHSGDCPTCLYNVTRTCSGTPATCVEKAHCDYCDADFGDFGQHTDADPVDNVCDVCNKSLCVTHVEKQIPEVPATCTEDGLEAYTICETCNQIIGNTPAVLVKTGHDFDGENWTSDGTSHWRACKNGCGEKLNAANHTNTTKYDANNHWTECSICGQKQDDVTAHTLKYGKDASQHWQACDCGYKTEKVDHEYSETYTANETQHWMECVCGATSGSANHTPEYVRQGEEHWKACTVCNREVEGTRVSHDFQPATDETHHWTVCECGEETEKVAHTFEAWKDATYHGEKCSDCDVIRNQTAHTYDVEKSDADGHWNECSCGQMQPAGKLAHGTPLAKSDETCHWTECPTCAFIIDAKTEHTFSVMTEGDDTQHWSKCSGCEAVSGHEDHTFTWQYDDNQHYDKCDTCGKIKNAAGHQMTLLDHNEEGHWNQCASCDKTTAVVVHNADTFGSDEENHWYQCSICGEISKTTLDSHTYGGWTSNGDNTHTGTCTHEICQQKSTVNCSGGEATCAVKAVCETCGGSYGDFAAHTPVQVEAKAADCDNDGNIAYWHCGVCEKNFETEACEKELTDEQIVIDKLGHNWADEWSHQDGYHWHACLNENCPVTNVSEKDGYAGHTPNADDGDCTTAILCDTCKAVTTEAKAEHNYEDAQWVSNGDGTHTMDCVDCDQSKTESCSGGTADCVNAPVCDLCHEAYGEALDHAWAEAWESDGIYHWHNCTREGCSLTDNTMKDGYAAHTPEEDDSSCLTEVKCSVCAYVTTEKNSKHSYEGAVWTGNGDGTHTRTCQETGCNGYETEKCTAEKEATCKDLAICDICGESFGDFADHTPVQVEAKAADCDNDGNIAYWHCGVCGKNFETEACEKELTVDDVTIKATDHKFATEWTYEGDYHWHECLNENCPITDVSDNQGYGAHTPNADDGNCTTEVICSTCKAVTTEAEEAHSFGEWEYLSAYYHQRICQNCGWKDRAGHNNDGEITAKDPTCTEAGNSAGHYCTDCEYVTVAAAPIDPLQHLPGEVSYENVVPATCTEPGSHDEVTYCIRIYDGKVCGEEASRTTVVDPAKNHEAGNAVRENEVPATCTEDGSHEDVVYCTREGCNAELDRIPVVDPATDHTPGELTIENEVEAKCAVDGSHDEVYYCVNEGCVYEISRETKVDPAPGHTVGEKKDVNVTPAQCAAPGKKDVEVYCAVCFEHFETEEAVVIPATGHTEVTVPAKEASCTEVGYTAGVQCSVCQEYLEGHEELPMEPHTVEILDAVDPTCTKTGLTEGERCTICEQILREQEEIPMLEHKWNAGRITEEPDCTEPGVRELTCTVCFGTTEVEEPALGHSMVQVEAKKPAYTTVGWEAYEYCKRTFKDPTDPEGGELPCGYTTYVEIPALGEPVIDNFDTFIENLSILESIADTYVKKVSPGKDPASLIIKYIRTGVERYNSGSWNIMAGYEDADFAKYVTQYEADYNLALADGEELMMVSGLKNLETFDLPSGDTADVGHIFGLMDISYTNLSNANVSGWGGDIVDLLSAADQYGVTSTTVEDLVKEIETKYFGKGGMELLAEYGALPIEGSFSYSDVRGDLDGYYIIETLTAAEYENQTLTEIFSSYMVKSLTDEQRAAYFLKNKLGGVTLRSEVRDAVFNEYSSDKAIATLEGTREFTSGSENLVTMRKAVCYVFADYLCKLAGDYVENTENSYLTVFDTKVSTLAPGVTQKIFNATTSDDQTVVYYIATADVTRDDVSVYANYNNNDPSQGWAMQRVLEQAQAAQANYSNPDHPKYTENFNIVAAINGDGYNMYTGAPSGLLIMEGVEWNDANETDFFAILTDGSAMIGTYEEYLELKAAGQLKEAIGAFASTTLVRDGKIPASISGTADRMSRTAVGVTASGKVVFLAVDGRQIGLSCGASTAEMAQIMLEAGCYDAILLDGGGSTTYVAKPEGESELQVVSSPSDGAPRSVSNSLFIASTAPSSTEFDHAVLESDYNYLTIGSVIHVTAKAVSATGNPVEMPEGTTWAVSDPSVGTIDENGVFTGKNNGSVTIDLMLNGESVGSKKISVVNPDNVYFANEKLNAIYGETITLPVRAVFEGKEVAITENDAVLSLANSAAGVVEGFQFTGLESQDPNVLSVRTVEVIATLAVTMDTENPISGKMTINLFKKEEASFDFNDVTGGDRQFAYDREVSNATQAGANYYNAVDPEQDMVTSYTFALDMSVIPIPGHLDELTYMLPGSDMENASAWNFLLQLAERVSVLTNVTPKLVFDKNVDVDYSGITVSNEYFTLDEEKLEFDPETNTLYLRLNWVDQEMAIDPATANPLCVVSGIKLKPKADADWGTSDSLKIVNVGDISYDIYLRANALYTFALKEENQERYGIYPFVNEEVIISGTSEKGGHISEVYTTFEDIYTLSKGIKEGWVMEDGGWAYYEDGMRYTGFRTVDGLYYNFGDEGINIGQKVHTGAMVIDGKEYYAIQGKMFYGWLVVDEKNVSYYNKDTGIKEALTKDEVPSTCLIDGHCDYTSESGATKHIDYDDAGGHEWEILADGSRKCIVCGHVRVEMSQAKVELSYYETTYTGAKRTPSTTVIAADGTVLTKPPAENYDYSSEYSNNVDVGTASVTMTAQRYGKYGNLNDWFGNAAGSVTVSYEIRPDLPTGISVLASKDKENVAVMSWTAAKAPDVTYVLYKSTDGEIWTEVYTTTATTIEIDANAHPASMWKIGTRKVVEGKTYESLYKSAIQYLAPIVTLAMNEDGKPTLKWSDLPGQPVHYVYRAAGNGEFVKLAFETKGLTYTHVSATAGMEYSYKVVAVFGENEESLFSNVVTVAMPCAAPVVTASVNESGKSVLSWAKVLGAASYVVTRSETADGTFVEIGRSSTLTYTDLSAQAGKTYFYKVTALSEKNELGIPSEAVQVNTGEETPVQPVLQAVTGINDESGKPTVKWEAPEKEVLKYEVYRSASAAGEFKKVFTTTGTTYTHTSSIPGTSYYYYVKALMADGTEIQSAQLKNTCQVRFNITTGNNTAGKPTLKWEEINGAESYVVTRYDVQGGTALGTFTTKGTTYTNTAAVVGKTYLYELTVKLSNGKSFTSEQVQIQCVSAGAELVVTTGNNAEGKPTIDWNHLAGAKSYTVTRYTEIGGKPLGTFTTKGTSYTNTAAQYGKTYYYQVEATMEDGRLVVSDLVSAECKLPDVQFHFITGNNMETGKPTLKWTAIVGAEKYNLYYSQSTDGPWTKSSFETKGTTYTNTAAEPNKLYYYKVEVTLVTGEKVMSHVVSNSCLVPSHEFNIITDHDPVTGKPMLKWTPIIGAERYEVYRSKTENGDYVKVFETEYNTYRHISAEAGKTYYYKLKVYLVNGVEDISDSVTCTCLEAPK